jgi:hypothetical protein
LGGVSGCNTNTALGIVSQTGISYTLTAPVVPGAATLASVTCANSVVTSTGVMRSFVLVVNGITISADIAQATVTVQCGSTPQGSAYIANLEINGVIQPANFDGSVPNQTMTLSDGVTTLTTNEQVISGSSITETAIAIHLANGSTIDLGTATGAVLPPTSCPGAQSSSQSSSQVTIRRFFGAYSV